jgi:hypothetical protein
MRFAGRRNAVPRGSTIGLSERIGRLLTLWLFSASTAPAQSVVPTNTSTVKADSLNVYSDMRTSSAVVMSLTLHAGI